MLSETPKHVGGQVDLKSAVTENRWVSLWRSMKGYRSHYAGATGFLMLSATLNTLRFIWLQIFIDSVLPNPMDNLVNVLIAFGLGFVVLALLQGLFAFLSSKLAAETSEGMAKRLKDYIYDHLQHLSFTYHDKMSTGELIQRCTSDIDAIRRFFAEQAIGIGRITMLFTVNFVALLFMDVELAFLSVIVIPFVVAISVWFFKRVSDVYEEFQNQEAKLSTVLQENLSGVRVVKAFARQEFEIDKFETENAEKLRLGKKFMKMHATFWPTLDVITGLQLVFGYFMGAVMTINGDITIGMFVAYTAIIIYIIMPIRILGRLIVQTSQAIVSFDRLLEILRQDRVPLGKDDANPVETVSGAITFEHVSFAYDPEIPVLKDVSFEAKAGQTVALLGSTGSGKTSLLALLPRFYDYTSGSIKLDGVELRDYPREFLRDHIGIVEQEPFLFSRSIRENIAYGVAKDVSEDDILDAAKAAAIHESIMSFPEGYDTIVGEKGVTLSGGQKQRVALARAILKNPKILILDDATSAVDTETESQIRDALQRMMGERTTFIIAHRIQSVMVADLILVMDKGEIIQRGTHDELMQAEGHYRRIYEMQARIESELESEMA